jgi:hypothetical protein
MDSLSRTFSALPGAVKIIIIAGALLLAANGMLGTWVFVESFIARTRDKVTDAQIKASDARIETLEKENAELARGIEMNKKELVKNKLEIEAKNQIIESASDRIKQGDREIERIIHEFEQSENRRIDSLSPDAVDAELRQKLRDAGRLRD